jgi:hypothetical protein
MTGCAVAGSVVTRRIVTAGGIVAASVMSAAATAAPTATATATAAATAATAALGLGRIEGHRPVEDVDSGRHCDERQCQGARRRDSTGREGMPHVLLQRFGWCSPTADPRVEERPDL